ncbi:uncharacterized protein DS421_19g648290 [Arachis hypogaea]|uniref:Uncharacterized protein n=1 Tax=Arachis hypogaea TaxID=3818 RepID=A0A6B9V5R7_ARAHY|nr:uncharacterized protein DS421_19g648290 [Arachis hypogaea]
MGITLVYEFYANAWLTHEEEAQEPEKLTFLRYVRGQPIDYGSQNVRRVLHILPPPRSSDPNYCEYAIRMINNRRELKVLYDICVPRAQWKLDAMECQIN